MDPVNIFTQWKPQKRNDISTWMVYCVQALNDFTTTIVDEEEDFLGGTARMSQFNKFGVSSNSIPPSRDFVIFKILAIHCWSAQYTVERVGCPTLAWSLLQRWDSMTKCPNSQHGSQSGLIFNDIHFFFFHTSWHLMFFGVWTNKPWAIYGDFPHNSCGSLERPGWDLLAGVDLGIWRSS